MTQLNKDFLTVHVTIQLHEYKKLQKNVSISWKSPFQSEVDNLLPWIRSSPFPPHLHNNIAARFLSPRDREPLSQIHTFNETAGHFHLIVADLIYAVLYSELNWEKDNVNQVAKDCHEHQNSIMQRAVSLSLATTINEGLLRLRRQA